MPRAGAAQAYPSRPVRVLVPVAPGGANDTTARLFAQKLSEHLGQQFYVEHLPGAGGNLAIGNAAMNAAFDAVPEVHGAASLLARGGCVARFLARSAADMTFLNQRLWDTARARLLRLSPFDHRKY